jgi:hypothetical protein
MSRYRDEIDECDRIEDLKARRRRACRHLAGDPDCDCRDEEEDEDDETETQESQE